MEKKNQEKQQRAARTILNAATDTPSAILLICFRIVNYFQQIKVFLHQF